MNKKAQNSYLVSQVSTASKEQLLIMLFDGAIRFSEQAKPLVEKKDIEGGHNLLMKAQKIMNELIYSLDRSVGEENYNNLCGLYIFVYRKLVDANVYKKTEYIDEALVILRSLRETWQKAVEKDLKNKNKDFSGVTAKMKELIA